MHRTVLHFLLFILMFLSGKTIAAAGHPGGDTGLSRQQAMRAAYGNVGSDNDSTLEYDGKTITFRPLAFVHVSDENGDKVFLVTYEVRPVVSCYDSDPTGPLIGFFMFEKAGGRWKLSLSPKNLINAGVCWQAPNPVGVVKIGPSSWALAIHHGRADEMGLEYGIDLFLPDANGIHKIFETETVDGYTKDYSLGVSGYKGGNPLWCVAFKGQKFCKMYDTELFTLASSGRLYDLKAITMAVPGVEGPDGKVVPDVIEESYFRFDAGQIKYIPVDKSRTSGPETALFDKESAFVWLSPRRGGVLYSGPECSFCIQ
jgi:hypothetical protein